MTGLKQFFKYFSVALVSFLFFMGVTLAAYFFLKNEAEEKLKNRFSFQTVQAESLVQRRISYYIQILKGAKSLFTASSSITRQEWKSYIAGLEVYKNYPGIQGIGFTEVIRPENLTAHIQRVRAEGYPNYSVTPAGQRSVYTPIVFIEPFTGRNLRAFGFDMFSDSTRRRAMERARDTGQPAITTKVRLVQETEEQAQAGFLLYLPVYQQTHLPKTLADRRRMLSGFVYSPFRVGDLMQHIFKDEINEISIKIYDGLPLQAENLLFSNQPDEQVRTINYKNLPRKTVKLKVAGHTWILVFQTLPTFVHNQSNLPDFVLIGGTIISLLVFFAFWSAGNLQYSNKLRQTITDNATVSLFILNEKGFCTFTNPMAEQMTGYTFAELQNQPLHNLVHHTRPDGSPFPLKECPIDLALSQNKPLRAYQDVFIRKDGTFFDVICSATPVFEKKAFAYVVLEVRDITEEVKAQAAIVESEARFRNMADNAPVMIWLSDEQGKATYLNKQWLEFTGQTYDEAMELGWKVVLHPDDKDRVRSVYTQAVQEHTRFEVDYRLRRYDGQYRWIVSNAMPRFDAAGHFRGYIGSVIDIAERKEAEQKTKDNANLLQKIFLEVPAIVALIRASDQTYIFSNPLYRKFLGNQALPGKNIRQAHPDISGPGLFDQVDEVIQTGKAFVGKELPVSNELNGKKQYGYFNLVYQPLLNSDRTVEAVLVFAIEVTELVNSRKKLMKANEELKIINDELRRTNTDLDNFVYTASHDLKAPVANLEGLINDMMHSMYTKLGPDEKYLLELLQVSNNKLKRTIADLTNITRVQKEVNESEVDLAFAEVLTDILVDLQPQIEELNAHITLDLAVPEITYARKNLRSILYNLVSNALKYHDPARVPEIKIATSPEGEFIKLTVTDNGLGIRTDQQHKLFSMFKRVHTHVEGSGIGLYIVKRIVENNGGNIKVVSQPGKGSSFHVNFRKPVSTNK
jgi:PAS domain S-box-containing protein